MSDPMAGCPRAEMVEFDVTALAPYRRAGDSRRDCYCRRRRLVAEVGLGAASSGSYARADVDDTDIATSGDDAANDGAAAAEPVSRGWRDRHCGP